jgi:hypothetical protein
MESALYAAHAQYYSSGADLDFINPGTVTLLTNGGDITFASSTTHLNSGTNLSIQTNGGEFSFNTIHGTDFENLTIDTGSGLALMGALSNVGSINTVTVTAGSIVLNGILDLVNLSLTATNSILNASSPVEITASNNTFFNSIHGNVGTVASPIFVTTTGEITAGATATGLAAFEGSSSDNTVHAYSSNPPCIIYFNGVKIKDCGISPPPSPSNPSVSNLKGSRFFAVVYVFDSQFNLGSDYFFFTEFLNDRYIRKPVPIFASQKSLLSEVI